MMILPQCTNNCGRRTDTGGECRTCAGRAVNHLGIINIQDEYGTPSKLFEQACIDFNIHPTLDICGSEKNHVLENYCDQELDCMTKEFNEDFFMNPPYSKVKEFMEFAYSQHLSHNVSCMILIFSKTDTKWWHQYVEGIAEVHFIKGRVKFNDHNGIPTKNSSPYPSCWIIYREK